MAGGRRFQTRRERIATAVAQEAGMVVDNNTVRLPRKLDKVQPSSMAGRRLELTSSEGDVREFLKKHAENVQVQGENVLISADTGMSEKITSEFEEARTVAEGGRAFSMTPSLRADFDKKAFPTLMDIKRHQVRLFGSAYGMVYSQCWLNEIKRAGGAPSLIRNDETFSTEAFAKDMGERCARQFCNGVNLKWTPKTKTSEEQLVMSFNDPAMAMVYETHLGHLGPRAPIDECALREFLAVELRHAVAEKGASEKPVGARVEEEDGRKGESALARSALGSPAPRVDWRQQQQGNGAARRLAKALCARRRCRLRAAAGPRVRAAGVPTAVRRSGQSEDGRARREAAPGHDAELAASGRSNHGTQQDGRGRRRAGDAHVVHNGGDDLLHDPTAQRAEGADGGCGAKGDPQPALYPGHNGAQGPSTVPSLRALRHAVSTSRSAGVGELLRRPVPAEAVAPARGNGPTSAARGHCRVWGVNGGVVLRFAWFVVFTHALLFSHLRTHTRHTRNTARAHTHTATAQIATAMARSFGPGGGAGDRRCSSAPSKRHRRSHGAGSLNAWRSWRVP